MSAAGGNPTPQRIRGLHGETLYARTAAMGEVVVQFNGADVVALAPDQARVLGREILRLAGPGEGDPQ
ncbi:hypothetical protein ACFVFS_05510 [Kitasatospora sp. NPDC057692]|uniref:hypothetical protein n=1 Tax=Kitasatospora sp. NPDC057692 TaxID=3346215 RepID=UPI0036C9407C